MTKADEIRKYKFDNPNKSIGQIAKDLGYHYATVRHAVLSLNKKNTTATTSKKEDVINEYSKPNLFKCTCPRCTSATIGTVKAYQQSENGYEHVASAKCKKCGTSFTMYLPKFKIEKHKE